MECNRDEALRAKEIAERKFLAKDMKGAKKFALKAQNLYPELDGISQMLRTFDVYISAEEGKVRGESNWYGVIGVTRLADDETIKKQYRKLALILHPDKNRSVGAEGAFSLVSQAWGLLSDKSKRIAYNQRCDSAFKQIIHSDNVGSSKPPKKNGFCNSSKAPRVKTPKGNPIKRDASSSGPYSVSKKLPPTFWTVCHQCKMQYEYLRMYLNRNLLCPNCREAYFAIEIDPPSTKIHKTSQTSNSEQRKNSGQQGSSSNNHQSNNNNSQWAPFSGSTGAASAVHAANLVRQAYDEVKRQRKKVPADRRKDEASKRPVAENSNAAKRTKVVTDFGTQRETATGVNFESGEIRTVKRFDLKQDCLKICKSKNDDSVCDVHLKQFLMEKARGEVCKKLSKNLSASVVKNTGVQKVGENIKGHEKRNQDNTSEPHGNSKKVEQMLENVPDSDFHDFDKERMETCFRENQIWAVYDDDDGMPRHYAMIHDVISLNPFKVKMSWLSSTTNSRSGHISWFIGSFSKTCGEFLKGRVVIFESINSFSHTLKWRVCPSKMVQIFPMKGDVWALYRNWSAEWNELTEDDVIFKYEIVEVLEDYDEELGVLVVPLSKVSGSKAVFLKHFDTKEIRRIPKKEMSQFSHQVPSNLLTGQEKSKRLKGCRELDPAATPLEFLEAVSEIEEIEFMEIDESVEFVKSVDCEKVNDGDRDCETKNISTSEKGILESHIHEVIYVDN